MFFPGKDPLHDYQISAIAAVCDPSRPGFMLVHRTGLGKTRSGVGSGVKLLAEKAVARVLIFTTSSTTEQWWDEIKLWKADLSQWKVASHHAMDLMFRRGEFDGLLKDAFVIIDEAHKLRTFGSRTMSSDEKKAQPLPVDAGGQRLPVRLSPAFLETYGSGSGYGPIRHARSVRRVRKSDRIMGPGVLADSMIKICHLAPKRLVLTASPISNSEIDLHNLASFIHGECLAASDKIWKVMINAEGAVEKYFGGRVSVCDENSTFGYKRASTMPEVKEETRVLNMSEEYYKDYISVEISKPSVNATALLGGGKPGPYHNGIRRASNIIPNADSPKVEFVKAEIKDMLAVNKTPGYQEHPEKMIIFSSFKDSGVCHLESKVLPSVISPKRVGLITGSTPTAKRSKIIADYNANKIIVLLFSSAASEGIDLKGTARVVMMEPQWNQTATDQAKARAIRLNSHTHLPPERRHVRVYHLILQKPKALMSAEERKAEAKIISTGKECADDILRGHSNAKKLISSRFIELLRAVSI